MTWLDVPSDHLFGITNLPYGVFSAGDRDARRVGVRIGEQVLDLAALDTPWREAWATASLNSFIGQGRSQWSAARAHIVELLTDEQNRAVVEPHLHDLADVELHLPIEVADYVDFYASLQHATNVGKIFRPDAEALTPNWKHLPIGYHGRSGTIVVSGTDVVRPTGQRKGPKDPEPVFGPSIRLDLEAEVGFVLGGPTAIGSRVTVDDAADHVFGVALFNDWSARDIQAWEYVPLGPFLGKSFASSLSAWVTPLEALESAKCALPTQDPEPLPYLQGNDVWGLDLAIEVELNGEVVSRPPYSAMYWSPTQMLAHMTVNGASVRNGDLFASGTCSGDEVAQRGSMLELTTNASEPLQLADGSTRGFLEDGDTVVLRATAPGADGTRIALGEVRGTILPAN